MIDIDNCVISHYLLNKPNTETEKKDIVSFSQMIELAKEKVIELGGHISTLMHENSMKSGELRGKFLKELKPIIKFWPVVSSNKEDLDKKTKCLHKIIQDKKQYDTQQLVLIASLSQARHFVTMDYKLWRQFNNRKKQIIEQCGINMFVITPSEFIDQFSDGSKYE